MFVTPVVAAKQSPIKITSSGDLRVKKIGRRNIVYAARRKVEGMARFQVKFDVENMLATVSAGRVNDYIPEINGVPITGIDSLPPPQLGIPSEGDAVSICLKITPNPETGRLDPGDDEMAAPGQLTIVAEAGPFLDMGESWYQELARVSSLGFLWQYAYFNYSYAATRSRGEDVWRHFISLDPSFIRTIDDEINLEKLPGATPLEPKI